MTGPREILRQARSQRKPDPSAASERIPAPIPVRTCAEDVQPAPSRTAQWRTPPLMHLPEAERPVPITQSGAEETQVRSGAGRVPVPQNLGGHAIYRELMRSHDRMGTRHIGPRA